MKDCNLSVFVRNESQLEAVKYFKIKDIYTDNYSLVEKYPDLYYAVPKNFKKKIPKNILIRDAGLLYQYGKSHSVILDYGMNIANLSTIDLLCEYGAKKMTLSLELPLEELKFFKNLETKPVEILIYGRVIDMTLKSHPIIKENGYFIEDVKKRIYPTKVEDEIVSIYHYEPINHIEKIKDYKSLGIQNFRIDFLEEDEKKIKSILAKIV